jgi:raffinose/stachyose/melibiose transport system substrate-binding protein
VLPVRRRRVLASTIGAVAALTLGLSSCAVGDIGSDSGGGQGETTEITFLTQDAGNNVPFAEALIEKFQAANPNIKVSIDTQPGGTEGDNLVKTKLATGEMPDVFNYNSGSLFQAINPNQNLVPLTDEPWVADLSEEFKFVVSTDQGLYGAPTASSRAGAVLYNKKVYQQLGLKVPTSWAEFKANNEKIKADGKVTPIQQTYGDTWTSQLFVLGDFANVAAKDPEWATQYTANKRKYSQPPALQSFTNQQESFDAGFFNKNFASATYEDGVKAIATGTAAHYPMLTDALSTMNQNFKENLNDVGVFPLPAQDAADTRLTIWLPNAMYIPKTTEGAKLDAAKKFVAFLNSPEGCEVQGTVNTVTGPFVTKACTLPDTVPAIVKDVETYTKAHKSGPALEFLSPIKGPNLERITVEVGSGIKSADAGAKLYDEDVKKQAQQLGLEGW